MNPIIDQIYRSGFTESEQGERIDLFPTSIPYEEGEALYKLIRTVKPARTLEIGMAYGLSTLFSCQAHEDNGAGLHTVIDPFERSSWKSVGLLNVRRAGLEHRLDFRESPSHLALPDLLREGASFDVIFVDGWHRFDYTILEFFYLDMLLATGGYMMFDDMSLPAIRKVVTFILRNRHYTLTSEFAGPPAPPWTLGWRLFKHLRSAPLDLLPSVLFLNHKRYCVLRKTAHDDNAWDYYRTF